MDETQADTLLSLLRTSSIDSDYEPTEEELVEARRQITLEIARAPEEDLGYNNILDVSHVTVSGNSDLLEESKGDLSYATFHDYSSTFSTPSRPALPKNLLRGPSRRPPPNTPESAFTSSHGDLTSLDHDDLSHSSIVHSIEFSEVFEPLELSPSFSNSNTADGSPLSTPDPHTPTSPSLDHLHSSSEHERPETRGKNEGVDQGIKIGLCDIGEGSKVNEVDVEEGDVEEGDMRDHRNRRMFHLELSAVLQEIAGEMESIPSIPNSFSRW